METRRHVAVTNQILRAPQQYGSPIAFFHDGSITHRVADDFETPPLSLPLLCWLRHHVRCAASSRGRLTAI